MKKNILNALLLLVLGGCTHRYKVSPLKSIKKEQADFIEEKEGVEIRLQRIDLSKASKIFNSKLRKPHVGVFQPLLLTVKNKTEDELLIKNKHIDLDLFTAQQLRQKFSRSAVSTVVGGIAAVPVFVIGSFLVTIGILAATLPLGGSSGFLVLPFLLCELGIGIPVIVGVTTLRTSDVHHYNQALSRDLNHKILEGKKIKPYGKETVLLFASHLPKHFNIGVANLSHEEKIEFDVNFKKKEKNHE